MKQITINIKNVCYTVFRHWLSIIVCMILFGVLFNEYGYSKAKKEAQALSEAPSVEKIEKIGDYRAALTEREALYTEAQFDEYKKSIELHEKAVEYYENSLLIGIDAMNVPTLETNYYVDNHYKNEYPVIEGKDNTEDIVNNIASALLSDDILSKINEKCEIEVSPSYISELITMTYLKPNTLNIMVISENEEICNSIQSVIDEMLPAICKDMKSVFGDFDLTKSSSVFKKIVNQDLASKQELAYNATVDYKRSAYSIANGITDAQRNYYYALIAEYENAAATSNEDNTEVVDSFDNSNAVAQEINVPHLRKKYLVVGIVFGLFVFFFIQVVAYCMSGVFKYKDDLQQGFGLSVLAEINTKLEGGKKIYNPIDKAIYSLFYGKGPKYSESEKIDMICSGVNIESKKKGYKKIFLACSCKDDETERIIQEIASGLKKDGLEIESGKSIIYDPKSFEKFAESDAVLFVEKVGESLYIDIEKEVELGKKYVQGIIGAVSVL